MSITYFQVSGTGMSFKYIAFKVQGLALVLLCGGCATSVRNLNIDDSTIIGFAQLNYHH